MPAALGPEEMERRLTTANWDELFVDEPPRQNWPIRRKDQGLRPTWDFSLGVNEKGVQLPRGALAGQKVELFFADLVKGADGVRSFDDLPIPFRAVATDLEDGGMKVFDSGPLPEVMRASMSVPGLFAPVAIDNHLYVDGGLVRNLPVDVARKMGVDLVIAVNLGSGYLPREDLGSVVGVLGQMIAILTEQNVQRSLKELRKGKDILIVPDLGDITSSDFNRAADAIKTGEVAARAAAPQLKRLSLSPEAYAVWRADRPAPATDAAPIAVVDVQGLKRVNPEVFAPLIAHQEGRPLDRHRLEADIQDLYGSGDYDGINYRIQQRDGKEVLVVDGHGEEPRSRLPQLRAELLLGLPGRQLYRHPRDLSPHLDQQPGGRVARHGPDRQCPGPLHRVLPAPAGRPRLVCGALRRHRAGPPQCVPRTGTASHATTSPGRSLGSTWGRPWATMPSCASG